MRWRLLDSSLLQCSSGPKPAQPERGCVADQPQQRCFLPMLRLVQEDTAALRLPVTIISFLLRLP